MSFSNRTRWGTVPNHLSRALAARRARGGEVLDLTEGNPTRAGLALPRESVLQALAAPGALTYEPAPFGLPSAREAVAGYYRDRGYAVDPARVVLTASTSEAYGWLFKLLCDPGDEVLIPHPGYPLFDDLARLEHVSLTPYPLEYEGAWHLGVRALERALSERSRAVLLVHPHNPTGTFLKRDELDALRARCAPRGVALVSDEVFGDFAWREDPRRVPSLVGEREALTFTLSGLSKVAALPQMKLGWIVVGGPDALAAEALRRLEFIADCYLSVGAPVQHAAGALLAGRAEAQGAIRARVGANLASLTASLHEGSHATLVHAEGGWYATLRVPRTRTEEDWALTLLEADGVLVHPGYFFDFPSEAWLVVSLLPPRETFDVAIARLLARVDLG